MKIGTVLIYHSSGIIPNLIRKFTKSTWNHTSIIGEILKDGYIIYEAQAEGFVENFYEDWYLEGRINNGTIVPKEFKSKFKNIKKECKELLGKPYGFFNLVRIAWSIIINKKERNWSDGEKHLICSEAISRILYDCSNGKINLPKEYSKTHDFVTPDDIFNSIQ